MRTLTGEKSRRRHDLRELPALLRPHPDLLAALLFVLIVLVAAWPIFSHPGAIIVGDDIDVYINPWADWWTLKALRDPALSLWQSDYIFYPTGADLSFHSFSHLNTAVSLLLRPLLGPLKAYNVTILANYVLIALSMFQLARYWTGSWTAGFLAAIVFAFNSHALYQSCHPVLLSIWVLPWTTLYLLRATSSYSQLVTGSGDLQNRRMVRHALIAAFFVFLAALISVLMLIILALWLLLLLLGMVLARRWRLRCLPVLLLFALTGALLSLPVLWQPLQAGLIGGDGSYLVDPADSLVTDLASLYTPHWVHWYIRGIYVGFMPAALALLALVLRPRRALPWLALFVAALLFAIGPVPFHDGASLDVYLPWSYWPALLLRNTFRLNILVSLGLAMLVAYGWLAFRSALGAPLPHRRILQPALGLLLALFILVEYLLPGMPYTELSVPAFYSQVLARMPQDVAVAIVPTGRQVDKPHLYYQTVHGHPMTNGVISRSDGGTESFVRGNALLRAGHYHLPPSPLPADPTLAVNDLAEAGVDLLVVEKGWPEIDVEAWRAVMPGEPLWEDGRTLVFEIGD